MFLDFRLTSRSVLKREIWSDVQQPTKMPQHGDLYNWFGNMSVVVRVCYLEESGPTHWGRRTLLLTTSCAPGFHDWARLSSWTWAGNFSTQMEPLAHRTCLTTSTWRQQDTAPCPSPSATCCFWCWRRCQRRDGHRWFEGSGQEAHWARGMSHLLVWGRHVSGTWRSRRGSLLRWRWATFPDVSGPSWGLGTQSLAKGWV